MKPHRNNPPRRLHPLPMTRPEPPCVQRKSVPCEEDDQTDDLWKEVELFVPSGLSTSEVRDYVHATIRVNAGEAGEFVARIRIGTGILQADGWRKCRAKYLPGPPGVFRDQVSE
jgi:hypothetical protein